MDRGDSWRLVHGGQGFQWLVKWPPLRRHLQQTSGHLQQPCKRLLARKAGMQSSERARTAMTREMDAFAWSLAADLRASATASQAPTATRARQTSSARVCRWCLKPLSQNVADAQPCYQRMCNNTQTYTGTYTHQMHQLTRARAQACSARMNPQAAKQLRVYTHINSIRRMSSCICKRFCHALGHTNGEADGCSRRWR
jgi:hypothetical protein